MKEKTYLVTGSAGFIGYHLAHQLLTNDSARVIGVDNLNPDYDPELKKHRNSLLEEKANFHFIQIDITEEKDLNAIFERHSIDTIFHLAGKAGVRKSQEEPRNYVATNIIGSINLLECAKKYNVPKIVMASSSSIYSDSEPPFYEEQLTDRPLSPYAASKKSMELFAHAYHNMYGLNIVLLRFFSVYGPLGRPDMCVAKFIKQIKNEQPVTIFGDGEQRRSFTYVQDIVNGIIKCVRLEGYHILNLGNDQETTSVNQLIDHIEHALGKKAVVNHDAPYKTDAKITDPDISKAKELLGWDCATLVVEGLKQCLAMEDLNAF